MNKDIWKEGSEVQAGWLKFSKIGDKFDGTYVDKYSAKDSKFNKEQVVFVFKKDGSVFNWGINTSRKNLIQRMASLKFGQIVGIEFSDTKDSGKGNDTKLYKIIANPTIVDEDWLKEQESIKQVEIENGGDLIADEDDDGPALGFPEEDKEPELEVMSEEESKLQRIIELAIDKLGCKEKDKVKDAVMEATGLAFLPKNYDQIIQTLLTV